MSETIVRKHRARPEVRPIKVCSFYCKIPVWEGDGRVDGLQRLLKHEREGYVGRHEPRAGVPVVAVLRTACGIQSVDKALEQR